MKRMILALALTVSSSAFANLCEVDMVDNRTRRLITSFRSYDFNDGCKEGMKACRLEIRQRGLLGRADCERRGSYDPYPYPQPQPQPEPYPYPYPDTNPRPDYDVRRPLRSGEEVYHQSRRATVVGVGYNGTYAIRTTDIWNNSVTLSNIFRDALSVTSGCNNTLCVNDSVISLNSNSNGKNARVLALSTDNRFVIETTDIWNNTIIQSSVDRSQLADTKGCAFGRTQICVGERVLTSSNREGTVIGIQSNGYVVLRTTDIWNNSIIQTNVNPETLYSTRRY